MTLSQWITQSNLSYKVAVQCIRELFKLDDSIDPTAYVITHGNDTLTIDQMKVLSDWADRIQKNEPIQYVFGHVPFHGLDLKIDARALIPRPETEELVDLIISYLDSSYTLNPTPLTLADIGTGSGAIALSLAAWAGQHNRDIRIIATDVSGDALTLAKNNYSLLHPIPSTLHPLSFRHGSLLQPITEPVDVITANLPYIPTHWLEKLDKNVKDFEPYVALDGGKDGLDLIKKMLDDAPRVLKPGAKIFLELWHEHSRKDFDAYSDQFDIEIRADSFAKTRFAILTRKKNPALLHDS